MLVFEEGGKPRTRIKTLVAGTRTNNKLNPHVTPSPGIEPGPHWWEAPSTLNHSAIPALQRFMLVMSAVHFPFQLQAWLQTSQLFTDMVFTLCCISDQEDTDNTTLTLHHKYVDSLALLLMEIVCPDVIPITFDWPDDDSLKFTIER